MTEEEPRQIVLLLTKRRGEIHAHKSRQAIKFLNVDAAVEHRKCDIAAYKRAKTNEHFKK